MPSRPTVDQLHVFVTVAEAGSFSGAGRRLHRAQSAISQSVATLEAAQGVLLFDRSGHRPWLTETGRALLIQARSDLEGVGRFEAAASATREGTEPELTVAIDPLVPTSALISSLQALRLAFPHLAVSFSTEGLRGAERRLRRGEAALAFCSFLPDVPDDIASLPLLGVRLVPVVAPAHPLAGLGRAATRTELREHVQLVLSDPAEPDGPSHGVISTNIWRFVDLAQRLEFLVAGLGWCRMPEDLVRPLVADGRLVPLRIEDEHATAPGALMVYAAHMRERALGRAGAWLLDDLGSRFA